MKGKKGFAEELLERGARAVGRAAGGVMGDPRGQEAVARALGLAQRGLRMFEAAQERAFHAAGLATRPDYQELRKQVARIRRKARELSERLEAAQAEAGGVSAEAPAGNGLQDEGVHRGFDEGDRDDLEASGGAPEVPPPAPGPRGAEEGG